MKYNLDNIPKNIEMRSGLSHFDKYHAYFENGDKIQIDAVLLCTGYIHHFPFMEQSLRLNCPQPDIYWPEGLYYSVAYQKNPKLFYVGMGIYRLSQVFFDLQGYLIRDIISGKHIVPEYIKQRRHPKDLQRQQDMKNAKTGQDYMDSGLRYAKDIIKMTGYPDFDIDKFSPIYTANEEDRAENFLTYRDRRIFQSIHTGQWSCLANKTWLQMKQVEPTHQQSGEQIRAYFNFNQSPSL